MKLNAMKLLTATLFLMIFVLPSCQKPFHEENERYLLVATNISLPYWQEAHAGLKAAAKELGVKADFSGPDSYSPEQELEAFKKAVSQRPAGILVSPARPELFKDEIDAAVKSGIPVICVDSDSPESGRIVFVGTDNYQAGLQSGRRLAELLRGTGRVVLITIPGQLNLDERIHGIEDAFKKFPKLEIVKTLDDKGDSRNANQQIGALLESKDAKDKFEGIICVEATGGPGAAEVLHRLNLEGKVPIVAMDDSPDTLDWISKGVISATIAQKPYTMSYYGVKLLDDLHHNVVHLFKDWRTSPVSPLPAKVDTGTSVIDSANLAAYRAAVVLHPNEP